MKPGGIHIFTTPLYSHPTLTRAAVHDGDFVHYLPPVYHKDPLGKGSLVFTEFGFDICDILDNFGFDCTIHRLSVPDKSIEEVYVLVATKKRE
ncbi:MAG: hypothetical protein PHP64_04115 [Actinomycetota bacterium]|nr:hypothetical protein [Actinomycetota bacterium]